MYKTWINQPVELFCTKMGLRNWLPAKGAPNYRSPKPGRGVIIGDNWHINRGAGAERRCDEVIWNAAHWHALVAKSIETFIRSQVAKRRPKRLLSDMAKSARKR